MRWLVLSLALVLVGCSCDGNMMSTHIGRHDGGPLADVTYPPGVGEICTNGVDDDGDGAIDCADLDCQAPNVDPGAVDFNTAYDFLFRGGSGSCAGHSAQTGYMDGAIDPALFAVVRGRVIDSRSSAPLAGARVFVQGEPQLGSVRSQADGIFELAVNAGTSVLVSVQLDGHVPLQRAIPVRPHDFTWAGEIAMTPLDTVSTVIGMGHDGPQTLAASMVEDSDGQRRTVVAFPSGMHATVHAADGTTRTPSQLTFRATELSVGPNGPNAMVGVLPSTTSYTYLVEVSADEVDMQGESISLSSPVSIFVDNFLSIPVGTIAPLGTYDRRNGTWTAELNGRIVRVLGINNGVADVDGDGDGRADSTVPRDARASLAATHAAGDELMWAQIDHFSGVDINYGHAVPPDGAGAPGYGDLGGISGSCHRGGSIIECENQVLGEVIPLAGGGALAYRSRRSSEYLPAYRIEFATDPVGPVNDIIIEWTVAGQHHGPEHFTPNAGHIAQLTPWDGTDVHGRQVHGTAVASVDISYVYDADYRDPDLEDPSAFDQPGTTFSTPLVEARAPITITRHFERRMGVIDPRPVGLGGWTLTDHHFYDRSGKALWMGDGEIVDLRNIGTQAQWANPTTGGWLFAEPSGSILNAVGGRLYRRGGTPVTNTLLAGSEDVSASTGDDGPASAATFQYGIGPVVEVADGTIYLVDMGDPFFGGGCVRRIDTSGVIHRVGGLCGTPNGEDGDGGPALAASLGTITAIAVGGDGSVYVSSINSNRVRRIRPDGIIERYAGGGTGFADGALATSVAFDAIGGLAIDQDGSLLIGDNTRLTRVVRGPTGNVVRGVAGNGTAGADGDGGAAVLASVGSITSIITMPGGEVCFGQIHEGVVRCITGGGSNIETVAGGGTVPPSDTGWLFGEAATSAQLTGVTSIAREPNGALLISLGGLLFETTALYSYRADGLVQWPSSDGSLLYLFEGSGRHVRTVDAILGTTLLSFGYDTDGHLASVTDESGHTMAIAHSGSAPTSITGFFGHVHTLSTDGNGWLSSVTDPLGGAWQLQSDPGGFLRSFTLPDGATSSFVYGDGRLMDDMGPESRHLHLDHTLGPLGEEITITGPRPGQREVYGVDPGADPLVASRHASVAGAGSIRVQNQPDGLRMITMPTGTTVYERIAADPRLGSAELYVTSQQVMLPSGRHWTSTESRTVDAVTGDAAVLPHAVTRTTTGTRTVTSTWDPATRTASTTTPSGLTSTTTLDTHARVVEERSPGLDPVQYAYDADGLLSSVTTGSGANTRTWSYTYDHGALHTATDPLMRTTTIVRDAAGRATSVTSADGRTLSASYDALDRPTSITPPMRGAWTLGYSPAGSLHSVQPPTGSDPGSTITITDDEEGDPATRSQGTGVDITYTRGSVHGRMEHVRLARGVFSTEFDANGTTTALDGPDGQRIAFDRDGEVMSAIHVTGGPAPGDVAFEWAADINEISAWVVAGTRVEITRDQDGAPMAVGDLAITRDPATGLVATTSGAGVGATFTYSSLGEETDRRYDGAAGTLYEHAVISRDALGRITEARESIAGATHDFIYHYDPTDRLDRVTRDGAIIETYGYHANGSRSSYQRGGATATETFDLQERLTSHGAETFTYRADGAMTSRTSATGTTTYDFDEVGSLLGVVLPDGRHVTYDIDPTGQRVGRRVDGALVHGWLYGPGQQPVAETDASGAFTHVFVYGPVNTLAPDLIIEGTEQYRLITDVRGSVRLVVRASDGAVVQQIDYDAYGRVTNDTSPGFQPFGYAGGLYDPDTRLVRFDAREYDPETARWLTTDPSGLGGGLNPYEYTGGDPINHIDPNGEFLIPLLFLAVDAFAMSVITVAGSRAIDGINRTGLYGCASSEGFVQDVAYGFAINVGTAGVSEIWSAMSSARIGARLAGACRGGMCDPPCSFDGETSVQTERGNVDISSIDAGDRVWSLDDETGEWGYHEVTSMTVHEGAALSLELIDDEAGVTDELVVTDNHPLFTRSRGWVQVGDLLPGDEVFTSRGGWARIGNATWIEGDRTLYDLSVDGSHTYFVGETGAWAHNCLKLRNGHLAGSVHPRTGVPFDADGYPDFSSWRHPDVPDVRITLSGNRATDAARANLAAGLEETPENYVWHHHQDGGLMQLIEETIHARTGHTGGFSL